MYEPISDYEASLTDANKADGIFLKNRVTDLENQYREAVGEDNEDALKEVGLLAIGAEVDENAEGEGGHADQDEAQSSKEENEDADVETKPHARVRIGGEQTYSEMERVKTGASRASMESGAWSVPAEAHIVNGGDLGLRDAKVNSLRGDDERFSHAGTPRDGGSASILVGGSNMGLAKKDNVRHKVIKSKAAKNSMRAIERCDASGL